MSLVFFVRWSTQLGQQAVLWWRHVTLAKCRECQAQPPTLPTNLCLSMEWNRARKPIKLEKGRLSHDLWWYILIFNRIHEKSRTSVLLVIYVYGNTVDGSKMQQFYWFHIIYICIYKGNPFCQMGNPEILQLKTTGQHRPSADEVARADASFRSEKVKVL